MKQSYLYFVLVISLSFTLFNFDGKSQSLMESRKSSYYTYIYQISSEQAKQVYSSKIWKPDSTFFYTKIDSFPTDESYEKALPQGHYLKVYSEENQQKASLKSVQNFEAFILNNNTDLRIQIYDLQGGLISNADLKIKYRKIRFDKQESAYIIKKANKKGLLEITVNGFTAFYNLEREYNNSRIKRAYRRVAFGTPIKYVWRPINFAIHVPIDGVKSLVRWWPQGTIYSIKEFFVRAYHNTACLFDDYYCDYYSYRKEDKHTGYFVFNKPKYLPGDTVKFKAFMVKQNGKPINKNLKATLYHKGKNLILANVIPYRKGAYEAEFILHDSLELQLDRDYRVTLESERGKDYLFGYFKYEDYELKSSKLSLRVDETQRYKNDSLVLYAKGTDENELNILDGRLEILLTPLNIDKFFESRLFVPDTLFFLEKKLDPAEETEIVIEDKHFPALNFEYNVNVKLITSDNEVISENQKLHYYYNKEDFKIDLKSDSLQFIYEVNGKEEAKKVQVHEVDNFGNKTLVYEGDTPAKIQYNQYFSSYSIQSDSLAKNFDLSAKPSLIQCFSDRSPDSLIIQVENPRKLPFSYNIYKKNREIASGYTTELNFRRKTSSKKNYFITIQYLWGGQITEENYEISLKEKQLNVAITQPRIVYPGQPSKVELTVTDAKGKPVEDVDLTAYAMTKKFGHKPPTLPYLGKERKHKELINLFELQNKSQGTEFFKPLDYPQWKKQAGLDSIEHYQFIYPENAIRKFKYEAPDSITQFSPFVFSEGSAQTIHVVYVDAKPVYFSWSTHNNPYSFKIDSGFHQIKLRTSKKVFTIDSLYFEQGEKLIFSVDEESKHQNVKIKEVEMQLSSDEKRFLYKYIFPYRNNFGERFAYLKQEEEVQSLNSFTNFGKAQHFAGPLVGKIRFHLVDSYSTDFEHEPFFEYEFAPQLLKMRSVSESQYPKYLNSHTPVMRMTDQVLTEEKLKLQWQAYLDAKRALKARYEYPVVTNKDAGKLLINKVSENKEPQDQPLNLLVFRYDNHEFVRVYPGQISQLHQLKEGYHQLLFFYAEAKYHIVDSIDIKVNGLNYFEYVKPEILQQDSFSIQVSKIIEDNLFKSKPYNLEEEREKKQIFDTYREQVIYSGAGDLVEGYVYEEGTDEPLPGVNVLVKGTRFGTITDIDGYYSLKVPFGYNTLQFSFIGMSRQEVEIGSRTVIDIGLQPDIQQLSEVVVTGYGTVKRSNLTSSVSTIQSGSLMGMVAGVSITGSPGSTVQIKIRGAATQSFESTPLYIINGQVYAGDIAELDPDIIKNIEILKGESATAIYGSRAANGVVIIDTKEGTFKSPKSLSNKGADYDDAFFEAASQSSAIRNNFSDYAFWQPKLNTDKKGKASFEVVFPDDVTSWETFYLAMNGKKQSGQAKSLIKSYKPLMAQLSVPRFLIEKDRAVAIGKLLNYTNDSIQVERQFEINGKVAFKKSEVFTNSLIDTLQIIAPSDSITLKYFLEKEDGYFDGEQKEIPVFRKGLEETKGYFYALDRDTTINLSFDPQLGEVKLYARADLLDIVEDEIQHVINYEYWCNEQIASKLKALLVEKKIADYRNQKFKNEREVKKLIRLLHKNQSGNGLWGWWKNSSFNDWISLHVLEALVYAEQMGYETKISKEKITEQMIWDLEYKPNFHRSIRMLKILHLLDAEIAFAAYINSLEEKEEASLNALLELTHLKQLCKITYKTDTLLSYKRSTLFGNIYFENTEQENNNLVINDLQNTLLAYKIIQADSTHHQELLGKMRGYFLEMRNTGYWRNTYESSKIIETILPALLQGKEKSEKPSIQLTGDVDKSVSTFPFEMTLPPDKKVSLSKSGDFPLYFTSYQRFWNATPTLKKDDFEVTSHFEDSVNILTAGKETKLLVHVKVEKDADYVMINIPIPGACSYADKRNNFRGESHREYFKHKTTIFIEKLPKGEYTYEINLMPRYSGTYTLNPAKVELMYFPTFNANNEIKTVEVK